MNVIARVIIFVAAILAWSWRRLFVLFIVIYPLVFLVQQAHAQVFVPIPYDLNDDVAPSESFLSGEFTAFQAYTFTDPIDPDRLGLATIEGRYSTEKGVSPGLTTSGQYGCEAIVPGINVTIVDASVNVAWVVPASVADPMTEPHCRLEIHARVSSKGCLTNTDGTCDVATESVE